MTFLFPYLESRDTDDLVDLWRSEDNFVGIHSLLLGSRKGSNSGCQPWQQVPLPAEPSHPPWTHRSVMFCLLFLVYSVYMYWYIKCCPPSHEAQFIIIPLCIHLYPCIFFCFYFPFFPSPLRSTVKSVTFSLQFFYFHLVLCSRHDVHHFLFHKTWAPPSSGSSEVVSCGSLNVVVVAALKSFSVTPNICLLSRSCLLLSVSCA